MFSREGSQRALSSGHGELITTILKLFQTVFRLSRISTPEDSRPYCSPTPPSSGITSVISVMVDSSLSAKAIFRQQTHLSVLHTIFRKILPRQDTLIVPSILTPVFSGEIYTGYRSDFAKYSQNVFR